MKYEEVEPITKRIAKSLLDQNNLEGICRALVRVAMTVPDRAWAQDQCLRFARHEDAFVRGVAATCLGHVARIHKKIDEDEVVPVVRLLLRDPDPQTRAIAEDTVDDFSTYLGWDRNKVKKLLAA